MAEIRVSQAAALVEVDAGKVHVSQALGLVEVDAGKVHVSQALGLVEISNDDRDGDVDAPHVRVSQALGLVELDSTQVRVEQALTLTEIAGGIVEVEQAALLVEINNTQVRVEQTFTLTEIAGGIVEVEQAALLVEIEFYLPVTGDDRSVQPPAASETPTSQRAAAPAATSETPASQKRAASATSETPAGQRAAAPARTESGGGRAAPSSTPGARPGRRSPRAIAGANETFAALAASRASVAPTTRIVSGAQTAGISGMSTIRQVSIAVQVDWSRTGTWVDESGRVVSVQGQHSLVAPDALLAGGRGAVATARVSLANDDGRFSAGVATSPLFSMLTAGVFSAPVRIDVTIDGAPQRVFTGVVRELSETGGTATTPAAATLECRGRDELLLNDLRSTPLADFLADNSQAHTEDFYIVRLLEAGGLVDGTDFVTRSYAAGHPGVRPTIDSGVFPIRFVWLDDESVLDQLWELVAACGGWCYCDADGKLHYHNLTAITPAALAQHYGTQTTLALAETNVAGVTIARPTRELYSDVTVETALRQAVPSAEIWTPDATITVQPGATRTIWATLSAPLAATPTLTAEAVDARGAALAGVTATPTFYAQRVRLDLANATGKAAYFTVLRLNGQLLDSDAAVEIEESSAAAFWSGRPRRRRRIKQNAYIQSDTQATTLARYLLRRQEQPQPQVTAQNIDRPDIRLGHPVAITYKDAIAAAQTLTGIVASLDWRCDRSGFRQNVTVLETGSLLAGYAPFFVLATHRLGASGTETAYLFY